MIKVLFILTIALFSGCGSPSEKPDALANRNNGTASFVFLEEFHNFGALQAGEIVSYGFCLKNTGTTRIKIEKTETDCGCLTIGYPQNEIMAGDSAYLDVTFNSAGETGNVYKEITVFTNAGGKAKLAIAAHVKNELINIYSAN